MVCRLSFVFDQIVNCPTHGACVLGACITNRSYLFDLNVEQSHKALIVNDKSTKIHPTQCAPRKSVQIRDNISLTSHLLEQSFAGGITAAVYNKSDIIDAIFNDFVRIVKWRRQLLHPGM